MCRYAARLSSEAATIVFESGTRSSIPARSRRDDVVLRFGPPQSSRSEYGFSLAATTSDQGLAMFARQGHPTHASLQAENIAQDAASTARKRSSRCPGESLCAAN